MLTAREFTENDKEKILDMVDEINSFDGNYEGLNNIGRIDSFDDFFQNLEDNKYQERIKPNYSPQTTFGVFADEKLIGGFNLRHMLKGNLINHGGHIGYLVRPSERGKGYGTQLLKLALIEAKKLDIEKVLVTCRSNNISSEKVILNNNGLYENNYYEKDTGKVFKRYWIKL